jgi:hypothetical protein
MRKSEHDGEPQFFKGLHWAKFLTQSLSEDNAYSIDESTNLYNLFWFCLTLDACTDRTMTKQTTKIVTFYKGKTLVWIRQRKCFKTSPCNRQLFSVNSNIQIYEYLQAHTRSVSWSPFAFTKHVIFH